MDWNVKPCRIYGIDDASVIKETHYCHAENKTPVAQNICQMKNTKTKVISEILTVYANGTRVAMNGIEAVEVFKGLARHGE